MNQLQPLMAIHGASGPNFMKIDFDSKFKTNKQS